MLEEEYPFSWAQEPPLWGGGGRLLRVPFLGGGRGPKENHLFRVPTKETPPPPTSKAGRPCLGQSPDVGRIQICGWLIEGKHPALRSAASERAWKSVGFRQRPTGMHLLCQAHCLPPFPAREQLTQKESASAKRIMREQRTRCPALQRPPRSNLMPHMAA